MQLHRRSEEVQKVWCSTSQDPTGSLLLFGCRTGEITTFLAHGQAHDNWIETVIYPGPHRNNVPFSHKPHLPSFYPFF